MAEALASSFKFLQISIALIDNFMTREEYRNKKQLDEARKAGNVPAEVDEEGKDINPHMPQYIMQAPWYSGYNHATLKHQRHDETQMVPIHEWYARGKKVHQAMKYRKGACINCGAMTHQAKDCFARPRKTGAKYTNQDIEADELVQDLKLDYDAKRDRWNGYDLTQYESTIKEYDMYAEEIRKRKRQEIDQEEVEQMNQVEEDKQEFGEQEEMGVVSQRDPKVKTMVRNLRQREDTAKYLMNLDVGSAYYDPISRSMRENPLPDGNITNKVVNFKGDNWYRYTGDAAKMIEQELFVWEQLETKGHDLNINTVGVPTATFIGYKEEKNEQSKKSHQINKELLQMYGGEEHLKDQWQTVGVGGQSENYLEWTRDGKIKRGGNVKSRGKSRYPEDQFEKGHIAVWGS